MQSFTRCLFAAALLAAAPGSALAHFRHSQHCVVTGPGLILKMSHYQQPDGTYDSVSDFVRDVNGTPCGIDCPAPSRVIWASPPSYVCPGY
ncbi:hypothetical protein CWB41_04120 [Methylovirgula ligni]|jgi:hypothetical protein|uniref:Uncharacterized protein n=1 Tax=Methylovirgula ligni TaxID=569860 RepID=A0A3D9YPJ4_9HYPH|nr:hypothetical protein [Methylovirgula ligni]QAY95016.1 hypothetical protein CWB41_04120 [Methylovirgula ligni]REF84520.1 hypothetical protein DES32_2629 [Methylovirgula ligni]